MRGRKGNVRKEEGALGSNWCAMTGISERGTAASMGGTDGRQVRYLGYDERRRMQNAGLVERVVKMVE